MRGEHDWVAQREIRHAGCAKPASLRAHGERGQQRDGLKPGLGE